MYKLDRTVLQDYVSRGLLREAKHPTEPWYLYKYTELCAFDKQWDPITLVCRGIVVHEDGTVLTNVMPKFFNHDERPNDPLPLHLPHTIFTKLDGSLINVSRQGETLIVSSSGSFESEQAQRAYKLIHDRLGFMEAYIFEEGLSYAFEYIYPGNRIVVDYGDVEDLFLLAVRVTETGEELDIYDPRFSHFRKADVIEGTMDEAVQKLSHPAFLNEEGFIVKWANGHRVKLKYDRYVYLHKVISGINEKFIWETLAGGAGIDDILALDIPDEVHEFVRVTSIRMRGEFDGLVQEVENNYRLVMAAMPEGWTNKDFALETMAVVDKHSVPRPWLKSALFNKRDGKSFDKVLWASLEPKGVTPTATAMR